MKKTVIIFLTLFIIVPGFSKNLGDTLFPKATLSLEIAGKAFGGIGFIYEKPLEKRNPEKHPSAFTSIEAGISYPFIYFADVMPGFGVNRNWFLFHHKKFIADAGIYFGAVLSFDPTPKYIRDQYKGMNTIPIALEYPFEPCLFSDLGLKMLLKKGFIKINLNPLIFYQRIYARQLDAYPWAG